MKQLLLLSILIGLYAQAMESALIQPANLAAKIKERWKLKKRNDAAREFIRAFNRFDDENIRPSFFAKTIQKLKQNHGDINMPIPTFNNTALHRAVAWRNSELVRALLAAGANPNARDSTYQTPLHRSCYFEPYWTQYNSPVRAITHTLLRAHASTNAADIEGVTPLMLALEQESIPRIKDFFAVQKTKINSNQLKILLVRNAKQYLRDFRLYKEHAHKQFTRTLHRITRFDSDPQRTVGVIPTTCEQFFHIMRQANEQEYPAIARVVRLDLLAKMIIQSHECDSELTNQPDLDKIASKLVYQILISPKELKARFTKQKIN